MATGNYLTHLALVAVTCAAVGCDAEGQETIGPDGGTVRSADGRVTLEIPAGALDHEVAITIGELDDGPDSQLGFAYEIEPKLTILKFPAELTFDLSDDGPADEARSLSLADAGMELADVEIVGEGSTGWSSLADQAEDPDDTALSASVLFLSTYAVVPRD